MCIRDRIDVAPELDGAVPFIEQASKKCVVSIAHTTANYDQAKAAFDAGATHVTHLFNAMPPFAHRDPGVVGAASDDAEHVEMISDGIHLHPAVVRSVFKWFGDDRVCLISDSMRAAGMPNGVYSLGGQTVYICLLYTSHRVFRFTAAVLKMQRMLLTWA